jgi:uncharacterized protein YaiI (UPF0178 family)
MKIYVDADAFPKVLKQIVFRNAERRSLEVIFVANTYIKVPINPLFKSMVVPGGHDVADDRIVELMGPGDLVITADIPLADRVVSQNGFAADPRGQMYTEANIKETLAMRNLFTQLREAGEISGGSPAFNKRNIADFTNLLDRFLTKHCK